MIDIKVGTFYKHFKGGIYCVNALAEHTETGELMVVYSRVNDPKVYVRPYIMCISKVDKVKYPDATQ